MEPKPSGPKGVTVEEIKRRRLRKRRWWIIPAVLLFLLLFSMGTALVGYFYITYDLPSLFTKQDYNPPVVSRVYDRNGEIIGEFFRERRELVPLSKMPGTLIHAFVAAEDDRFFEHPGIDVMGILRAFVKNIKAGKKIQGGSTITQQITRSLLLTPEKSYRRKIREVILAYRLENRLSKEDILYIYLNQIYLGHGAYGVEAASRAYYGKSVSDLNLAECAMLAGLPRAPSRYSPYADIEKARERQSYVLRRMVEEGYITPEEAEQARSYGVQLGDNDEEPFYKAPYFTEYVRQYVEATYGADELYEGGLRIYTTVDAGLQKIAQHAVARGIEELDKRIGYRGPLEHLKKSEWEPFRESLAEQELQEGNVVTGLVTRVDDSSKTVHVSLGIDEGIIELKHMVWARHPNPKVASDYASINVPSDALKPGDRIKAKILAIPKRDTRKDGTPVKAIKLALEQEPDAQAALLCMENDTGFVRALVGGSDFRKSQFNRALQARRQPGSAFKPIVYAAALDKGFTPVSIIIDSPVVYDDPSQGGKWKPQNYEEEFYGPTLLREALIHSRNVVTVKLLQEIGVGYVIDYARKLGIQSDLVHNLSLGLGSSDVTLLEIVRAYTAFANGGMLVKPVFITKVVDKRGLVLEESEIEKQRAMHEDTSFVMTHLLTEVVQYGTGKRALKLNRPAAGKTGTTNDLKDAWFIGFTPELCAGVWVGFDDFRPMGRFETGARAASPIWVDFMRGALTGKKITPFSPPEGVTFAKIDPQSGKLASFSTEKPVFECFKMGTEPTEYAEETDMLTPDVPVDFFKTNF